MEEKYPEAAREIEEELRAATEQLARIEVAREAGLGPDTAPPRLPEGFIPLHIRQMSHDALDKHITRLTRDLEAAQSGWGKTEGKR